MDQKHISVIKRISAYTAQKALSNEDVSFFTGKSGAAVALFETANLINCEETEEQAAKLMEQALSHHTDTIEFGHGLSGIGYALLYLIRNKHIENNIELYFGKNRSKIRTVLYRSIKQEQTTQSIFDTLNYLVCIYLADPNEDEKQLIEAIANKTINQLIDAFDIHTWIKGKQCKPAIIDLFIALLRITDSIDANGLPLIYNPYLFDKLIQRYASIYQAGYVSNHYTLGYYLEKRSNPSSYCSDIAQINKNTAIKGIETNVLPIRKKRELYYLLSENNTKNKDTIHKIDNSLTEYIKRIDKEHFPNAPYGLTNGTSALLLHITYKENLLRGDNPTRFSHLIF